MAPILLLRVCSLVLAISSLPGTLAQVCTSSNLRYHISSQDQLDVLAQNCTVLDSPFYIESNYTGSSFVLHNVTNISQDVIFEWSEDWPRSQGPISVEFPDLIYAKRIGLWEAVSLTKLSLPKLEYVETFSTFGVWGMPDLEFPSLKNTSQIDLLGNISRVSFPALKTVHGALSLDNISDPSMRTMNTNPLTIDLSLPVLEKAYEIKVTGTVARMSAPELTTVRNPRTDNGALILALQGDAKALSLPKLSAVGGSMRGWIQLGGNLSSLSLPSLRNPPPEFNIWPSAPLDIELAVEYGERISIGGPIKSVSFPSLRNFTHLDVGSTIGINCGSFIRGLKENVTAVEVDEDRNVSCYNAAVVLRALGARNVLAIAVVIALVEFL